MTVLTPLPWIHDDGGRAAAGYTGTAAGDCAARAIAIATHHTYQDAYALINEYAARERRSKRRTTRSHARTGVYMATFRRIMTDEFEWEWTPTMHIGSGCQVHLAAGEIPDTGPLIVRLSRHYAAVVDGVVRDNHDPGRDGTRCVYGYWRPT